MSYNMLCYRSLYIYIYTYISPVSIFGILVKSCYEIRYNIVLRNMLFITSYELMCIMLHNMLDNLLHNICNAYDFLPPV